MLLVALVLAPGVAVGANDVEAPASTARHLVAPRATPTGRSIVRSGSERALAEGFGIFGIRERDVIIGPWDPGLADQGHWFDVLAPFTSDWAPGPEAHHLFGSREFTLDDGSVFVESTDLVVRWQGRCRGTHRRVIGIDTGIEGEVGERIEAVLRAASRPDAYYSHAGSISVSVDHGSLGDPDEDCTYRDAPVTDWLLLDSVVPLDCELPGRPLRCYVVSTFEFSYLGRPTSGGRVLLFDATTGMHLDRAALYVGLDADEGDRLIGLAVGTEIEFDRLPEGVEVGQTYEQLVPTAEGLAVVSLRTIGGPITPSAEDGDRIVVSWRLFRRAVEHRAAHPLAS